MKTHLTFFLVIMIGFISTAQNSKLDIIDNAIAIKPSLTLIDFGDKSFSINKNTPKFNAFKYPQNLKKQLNEFNMNILNIETMRDDFLVLSPKYLKKSFFQDFNITYRRSQLKRLLPRLPDISDFSPCF